jgi:hypothetical protein
VNIAQAKEVLLLYRPGTAETPEPEMAQALELARTDPDLGRWFEEHRAFQKAMTAKFRQIEVPAHLKSSLLIRGTISAQLPLPAPWWRRPVWLAATAALAVLLLAIGLWPSPEVPDRFANYKARMVTEAQRAEYRMDLVTNDMRQIRQLMANGGAPADYDVPKGLEHVSLTGGAVLNWRNNPVAMVCFDRGDKQMLFLFVMKRSAVKDAPQLAPDVARVSKLLTVSWTRGDNTYILAGPEEAGFLAKYL